jgi:hypothetical protein
MPISDGAAVVVRLGDLGQKTAPGNAPSNASVCATMKGAMWRILLVVWLIVILPEAAMAARWERAEVPVWDFTRDDWRPYVQATVEDFNANMPPGVPRLIYTPMGELRCEDLPNNGKRGGISVCLTDAPLASSAYWAEARRTLRGQRFTSALIAIDRNTSVTSPGTLLCHEMTHEVFDAPDDDSRPHPNDSCVQGYLDHLGSWDIAYAASVYSQDGHHGHPKHHRP